MEERPRNIHEDDSSEDLENEDGELSLNRRRLFLKNGFFREWLSSSSKETEDEDQEDDDKPVFGSGKKFKGFLSKIFEEEIDSDKEEPQKPLFELGDFSADTAANEAPEVSQKLEAEETEVRIEHEEEREPVAENHQEEVVLTEEESPEITQEYSEPTSEDIKFTHENVANDEPEPEKTTASKETPAYGGLEQAQSTPAESPKIERNEAPRKDRSGALVAFIAAEILSRRRDREIKRQVKKTRKNLEAIEASLRDAKKAPEVAPKIIQKETIKDAKNTTNNQAKNEKTSEFIDKKQQEKIIEKTEKKKEIVIEKTTPEVEQIQEPQAEVYFDKRHEVMGLEKTRQIDQETPKEKLREAKDQAPVSVASVLASKQIDQLEYIAAPIPMTDNSQNNDRQSFEQEISPKKSVYRESVEAGFMLGLIIIGFIAVYVISK